MVYVEFVEVSLARPVYHAKAARHNISGFYRRSSNCSPWCLLWRSHFLTTPIFIVVVRTSALDKIILIYFHGSRARV